MDIKTRYTPTKDRVRPKIDFSHPKNAIAGKDPRVSLTKQSDRDMADINNIVKKGILSTGFQSNRQPRYGDFTNAGDFLAQQTRIAEFNASFEALPSHIRNKFDNAPEAYLDYIQNPENKEEAIKLGLLPKPVISRKKVFGEDGKEYVSHQKDGVEFDRTLINPTPADNPPAPGEPTA